METFFIAFLGPFFNFFNNWLRDTILFIYGLSFDSYRSGKFKNVNAITMAKVPIVKFECKEGNLEGDLSLFNTLALHNTKMMWTYSMIDERAKVTLHLLLDFLDYLKKILLKINY